MSKCKLIVSSSHPLSDQIDQLFAMPEQPIDLSIEGDLSTEDIKHLTGFLQKSPFILSKLTLKMTMDLLQEENFKEFAETLQLPLSLNLVFDSNEINPGTIDILNQKAVHFSYPVYIGKEEEIISFSSPSLAFQDRVIANIQRKKSFPPQNNTSVQLNRKYKKEGLLSQPILLKELILNKKTDVKQYISLEIQHVQEQEQEQEQEIRQQVETEILFQKIDSEIQTNIEMQEIQKYEGKLLDCNGFLLSYEKEIKETLGENESFTAFRHFLQQELLINLPHAIKYLSPEAADKLILNLSSFAALNKENLPQGFLLKQTSQGEYVLDYQPYALFNKPNVFTPSPSVGGNSKPIYDVSLNNLSELVNDEALYANYVKSERLINMWIQYGDKGVMEFFRQWKEINPELMDFIYHHYLIYFPQWDLFADPIFFENINKINQYDNTKRDCLKKFLLNTGCSKHDLSKTIEAFEVFWDQINNLCIENKVELEKINSTWKTLGGNPVVYMERLLFILQNARDFSTQLSCLNELSLDSYKAYYAAKYEGFKTVASEMEFTYEAANLKEQPFDKNYQLYAIGINQIVDAYKEGWDVKNLCLRFIGLQTEGIALDVLLKQWKKFSKDKDMILLCSLFFISHDRFASTPLKGLFQLLDRLCIHDIINYIIDAVANLYTLDNRLNELEAMFILSGMAGMNSDEYERRHFPSVSLSAKEKKLECITKFFKQFEQNRFATLRVLEFCLFNDLNSKYPLNYMLDTNEYLSQDPKLASYYRDDLLFFSFLTTGRHREVFSANGKILDNNLILEKVRNYLLASIPSSEEEQNNLNYAIKSILRTGEFFTFAEFIDLSRKVSEVDSFNPREVDAILATFFTIVRKTPLPNFFKKDKANLKPLIVKLLELLGKGNTEDLNKLSYLELREILKETWEKSSEKLSIVENTHFRAFFDAAKDAAINSIFDFEHPAKMLLSHMAEQLCALPDFQNIKDFQKLSQIEEDACRFSKIIKRIAKLPCVLENETQLIEDIKEGFPALCHKTLFALLSLLDSLSQRNFFPILHLVLGKPEVLSDETQCLALMQYLTELHQQCFPTPYLESFAHIFLANPKENFASLIDKFIELYIHNHQDVLLRFVMTTKELSYENIMQLLCIYEITADTLEGKTFLGFLVGNNLDSILEALKKEPRAKQKVILDILSKVHDVCCSTLKDKAIYWEVSKILVRFSSEDLAILLTFIENTPVSIDCLSNALKKEGFTGDIGKALQVFEKEPFGPRDLDQQFQDYFEFEDAINRNYLARLERVINSEQDILNTSTYPYLYRKQLMDAYLFVNRIGYSIPIYNGKSAKDLSNEEIRKQFHLLKYNPPTTLTPFNKRLLALGLLREAMYRSTGQFPYSTQIVAVIDAMMHEGDYISNINTGEGKSLIDFMKAAILWLDSDRVDICTSSLVEVRRDLARYAPFLRLLNIPYAKDAITPTTDFNDFKENGINMSTFSQLSLFFSKAKIMEKKLDTPTTRLSLVVNESDYALLDDRTIYRYATTSNKNLGYEDEWVYYAINEFVSQPSFLQNKAIAQEDVEALKTYLKFKMLKMKKIPEWVESISDEQYLAWLQSSLLANYVLEENKDYVISEDLETKRIGECEIKSKVIEILMKNGKASPDSTYGNAIQQFLYARLNYQSGSKDFIIEPLHTTLISSNNKNLVDYYRRHPGFIWASSATVGSKEEVKEQFYKYGFEFSKLAPHKQSQVRYHPPVVLENEALQFKTIRENLDQFKSSPQGHLVFCKDIETATRLFNFLKEQNFPPSLQLYTGIGQEEEYIKKAAYPGMITITTKALGRNTDIPYDRNIGFHVWQTFYTTEREEEQQGGRTGREGSYGEVHYILNKEDLKGKTKEDLIKGIEDAAKKERLLNEKFYDIMQNLLTELDCYPKEAFLHGKYSFYYNNWSKFSSYTERSFKEYWEKNPALFEKDFIHGFTAFIKPAFCEELLLDPQTILEKAEGEKHVMKAPYYSLNTDLRLTTSLSSAQSYPDMHDKSPLFSRDLLGYQCMSYTIEEESAVSKEEVKEKLRQLDINRIPINNYLQYLLTTPATQAIIVAAHKEFLSEFLSNHLERSTLLERWRFWHDGELNSIVSNTNYLLMFYALSQVPREETSSFVECDIIKKSIVCLINEYLDYSWCINTERKQRAADLKSSIQNAEDSQKIIEILIANQIDTAISDVKTVKEKGKNLHLRGNSRYQVTLTRAIALLSTLSNLDKKLNSLIVNLSALISDKENLSYDEFKHLASTASKRGHTRVLFSCLDAAFTSKERQQVAAMGGRHPMFFKQEAVSIKNLKGSDLAQESLTI